jgi:hypothetical protein
MLLKFKLVVPFLVFGVSVGACGKKKSSSRPGPGVGPGTVEELNPEQKKQLDDWKNSLIKSCSFSAPMPWLAPDLAGKPDPIDSEPAELYIDLRVLAEQLNGSSFLTTAAGEFIYFGAAVPASGSSTESRSFNVSVNGSGTSVSVKAEFNGTSCALTYNDAEIYKTSLSKVQNVELFLDQKSLQTLAESKALSFNVQEFNDFSNQTQTKGRRVKLDSLLRRLQSGLEDKSRATAVIAQQLGLTPEVAAQYFKTSDAPAPLAFSLSLEGVAPADTSGQFFGPDSAMNGFGGAADQDLEISAFYKLTDRLRGDTQPKLYGFKAAVQINGQQKNADGSVNAQSAITSLRPSGFQEYDPAVTQKCFQTRHQLMFAWQAAQAPGQTRVAFDELSRPCQAFVDDFSMQLAEDAVLRNILVNEFVKLQFNSSRVGYMGWDVAFIRTALALDAQKKDLKTLLTPADLSLSATESANRAAILEALDRHEDLGRSLGEDPSLNTFYRPVLLDLSLAWMLSRQTPADAVLVNIKSTLMNIGKDFVDPVQEMLKALRSDASVNGAGAKAALCGAAFSEERKNLFYELLQLAQANTFLEPWMVTARRDLLVNCWPDAQLGAYKVTATALNAWFAAEKAHLPQFRSSYDLDAAALATKAMNERWTESAFTAASGIAEYAAVSGEYRFCASQDKLPTNIVQCSTLKDAIHAREGGMLFAPYGGRYAELAKMLSKHQREWLSDSRYFRARYDIEKAFFKPDALWSLCSAEVFTDKTQKLDQMLMAYQKATAFTVRNQLETDITSALSNCP